MALVHVEHLGCGQPFDFGEGADRSDTADTGQDLLLDPVLLVAAVEPVGDTAQIVLVLGNVGIQQQQRNSADLRNPDACPQLAGVGHRQLHQHRVIGPVREQPQRQPLRVQRGIILVLPAVGGQRLAEIAGPVVQAHRDQGQAQIRGRLQVVAGQNPQPAGVVRQHLGDTELHREVGDAGRQSRPVRLLVLIPQRPAQVIVQIGDQRVEALPVRFVGCQFVQPLRADLPEQRHRIASDLFPQLGIDGREQVLRRLVPRPAQVDREPFQREQAIGKVCADREPAEGFHATKPY